MRIGILLALSLLIPNLRAQELAVCYNYGCNTQGRVSLHDHQLKRIGVLLGRARTPGEEREAVSQAIGLLENYAGQQTPTWRDRGENYNDDGVDGRMDCIDHSTNTTRYLRLLEARGWLRFHRVADPAYRAPLLFNAHWAANIVDRESGMAYAVDSWFFDNGQPAAVLPLDVWRRGWSPNG
jgi:hypothetical protein